MKQVITALDNPILNNEIKKESDLEILCKDIQYQEGVLEILDKYKKIDFIIISELLAGKYKIEELINKIKEKNKIIKIIVILENKKDELENLLYSKGVYKIFYNNEIEIINIINIIKNDNEENIILKEELEKIKKILSENNIEINLNEKNPIKINNKKYILKKVNSFLENEKIINIINKTKKQGNLKNNKNRIISILGTGGIGKSVITISFAQILKKENNKVLIIDFDILNNSLHTILGVDKYPQKIKNKMKNNNLIKNKIEIKNLIIKINKNLDLISGINLLFDKKYKISNEKVKFILEELKQYYDYIIIDTSSECFFDYTKNIIKESDFSIFLLESNLSEMKKAQNLLKIYNKKWNINKDKIKLLINKYNKNSIDENVLKNVFNNYKILGKLNFNEKYNRLIDSNFNEEIYTKDIKEEYKKLVKNL